MKAEQETIIAEFLRDFQIVNHARENRVKRIMRKVYNKFLKYDQKANKAHKKGDYELAKAYSAMSRELAEIKGELMDFIT